MRKEWSGALIAANALWTVPAFAEVKITGPFVHKGMCEASGAVVLPAKISKIPAFLVVNDEDNVLRVYAADRDGGPLPVAGGDLNCFLQLDPTDEDDKADLEGVTQIDDRIYVLGSHSRSGKKGEIRKARHQFFAVKAKRAPSGGINIFPDKSAHSLLDALVDRDKDFKQAIRPDIKEDKALIPEAEGLNIEALTSRPGGTMFIGLRNPLSGEEAFVVPFENPAGVVEKGAKPDFGEPIALDLGGRGIRSMEYSPSEGIYYIMAGAAGKGRNFELYRWSGRPKDKPVAVAGAAKSIADAKLDPEAMMVDHDRPRLHLLSDDGETCPDPTVADRSFRSFIMTFD